MSEVGIYIETQNGEVKGTNFELATLVRQAGRESVGILFGGDPQAASEVLGPFGMSRILHVNGESVATYHPEIYGEHLAHIIQEQNFTDFLGTVSVQGKDILPRVAAQLDAPLITDCIAVNFKEGEAVKPMYSGKVNARLKVTGDPRLYAMRPNSIVPEKGDGAASEVTSVDAAAHSTKAEIREVVQSVSKEVDLTEAQVIVAGGYGMGNAENFELLRSLADVLGAAVGASRRAVDEGFAPYKMQVGQTGKVVNPQLYIACGISGAVQHFAGMKSSKVIVAINKDPEAPIFKKAHYGIVGDLFEVVPVLIEEFKNSKGNE